MERFVRVLRDSAKPYLFLILLGIVLGRFAQYLWQYVWPSIPVIFGQAPEIYVKAFLTLAAAGLWLFYRGVRTRQPLLIAFLITLMVGWVVLMVIAKAHVDPLTYDTVLYVPVLLALLFKTPTVADLKAGLRFVSWVITVILVSTRAAEMLGWIPMVDVGEKILAFEKSSYWLPFANTLGPEGRWPGPMGHNAMTGNAGAMLVIVAVGLKGRSRWVFGTVGVLTLLLTGSRGSQIAAVAGILAMVILGDNAITRRFGRKWLLIALGSLAAVALALVLIRNPNLTGRTKYWSLATEVWQSSPLFGAGASGMADSPLAIAGSNAHNLLFDALVKAGLIGAAFLLLAVGLAVIIAWRASSRGSALAAGLLTTYLVIGLAESDQYWLSMTMPWMWLVLAIMLGGRQLEEHSSASAAVKSEHLRAAAPVEAP